ncbi:Cobalt-precorrin-5A hydrolase [Pseudomonas sp. Teo4]|nr:Cobalt-precorrin-5A hydrolase [Pseudomonas sp. Teo4]
MSSSKLYAGIGCRQGCPATTLDTLLRQALDALGLSVAALGGIASIDAKADEPGLLQLAEQLDLPLTLFDSAQLLPFEPLLSHRSPTVFAHSGCWGVAESAALALATRHQGAARLVVTRQVLGPATLALACGR